MIQRYLTEEFKAKPSIRFCLKENMAVDFGNNLKVSVVIAFEQVNVIEPISVSVFYKKADLFIYCIPADKPEQLEEVPQKVREMRAKGLHKERSNIYLVKTKSDLTGDNCITDEQFAEVAMANNCSGYACTNA